MLNAVRVIQSHEHYNCRDSLETLLTCGTDAASTHLYNSYCYLYIADMRPCDPMAETHIYDTNDGFIARWSRLGGSRDVQIFGRLHTDPCNVPLFLLPRIQLQIKLTKTRPGFYLMNKTVSSENKFQLSGRLPDGQTIETEPSNSFGSRNGVGRGGSRSVYRNEIRPYDFYIFARVGILVYRQFSDGPPPQTPAVHHV